MAASTTGISWTDTTWNPVHGCDRVTAGCDNCYALTMANRLKGMGQPTYQQDGNPATSGPGFAVTLVPGLLTQPLRWKTPRRVFVDSMGDLFHDAVPDDYIAKVFAVISLAPQHTFQLLTKRHGRMGSLLSNPEFEKLVDQALLTMPELSNAKLTKRSWPLPKPGWPLPNLWLGVSIEDQKTAKMRLPALLATPAAVRWISAEPLLSYVRLRNALCPGTETHGIGRDAYTRHDGCCPHALDGLHWIVVGGESGPNARPMHPQWAFSLRDQAIANRIPLHFKQWGQWGPMAPLDRSGAFDFSTQMAMSDTGALYTNAEIAYPEGPRYGEAIRANEQRHYLTSMYPRGTKANGRDLARTGDIWDQYPGDTQR